MFFNPVEPVNDMCAYWYVGVCVLQVAIPLPALHRLEMGQYYLQRLASAKYGVRPSWAAKV